MQRSRSKGCLLLATEMVPSFGWAGSPILDWERTLVVLAHDRLLGSWCSSRA